MSPQSNLCHLLMFIPIFFSWVCMRANVINWIPATVARSFPLASNMLPTRANRNNNSWKYEILKIYFIKDLKVTYLCFYAFRMLFTHLWLVDVRSTATFSFLIPLFILVLILFFILWHFVCVSLCVLFALSVCKNAIVHSKLFTRFPSFLCGLRSGRSGCLCRCHREIEFFVAEKIRFTSTCIPPAKRHMQISPIFIGNRFFSLFAAGLACVSSLLPPGDALIQKNCQLAFERITCLCCSGSPALRAGIGKLKRISSSAQFAESFPINLHIVRSESGRKTGGRSDPEELRRTRHTQQCRRANVSSHDDMIQCAVRGRHTIFPIS